MEPKELEEKFGVSYLTKKTKAPSKRSFASGMDSDFEERLEAYAAVQVVDAVVGHDRAHPGEPVPMKTVSAETSMPADILLPITRKLEGAGFIEARLDSFGDGTLTLTESGRRLANEGPGLLHAIWGSS